MSRYNDLAGIIEGGGMCPGSAQPATDVFLVHGKCPACGYSFKMYANGAVRRHRERVKIWLDDEGMPHFGEPPPGVPVA